MSRFSGKCDLYDRGILFGSGLPALSSEERRNPYLLHAWENESFLRLKESTKGIIYQGKTVAVTWRNGDFLKGLCPKHLRFAVEKSAISGGGGDYCVYRYRGKVFQSAEDLNKEAGGVYIEVPIYVDTLLDLVPYYPYLVNSISWENGQKRIVISSKSFVDMELEDLLENGILGSDQASIYREELRKYYVSFCRNYLLKDIGNERQQQR